MRIHTVLVGARDRVGEHLWNVANCQSSGFHAGIGSPKMLMLPLNATAMTA